MSAPLRRAPSERSAWGASGFLDELRGQDVSSFVLATEFQEQVGGVEPRALVIRIVAGRLGKESERLLHLPAAARVAACSRSPGCAGGSSRSRKFRNSPSVSAPANSSTNCPQQHLDRRNATDPEVVGKFRVSSELTFASRKRPAYSWARFFKKRSQGLGAHTRAQEVHEGQAFEPMAENLALKSSSVTSIR